MPLLLLRYLSDMAVNLSQANTTSYIALIYSQNIRFTYLSFPQPAFILPAAELDESKHPTIIQAAFRLVMKPSISKLYFLAS